MSEAEAMAAWGLPASFTSHYQAQQDDEKESQGEDGRGAHRFAGGVQLP